MLDYNADYKEVISSEYIDDSDKIKCIELMISKGKIDIIIENLAVVSLNQNWYFAQEIPMFREILLQNLEKALENEKKIYGETLIQISDELDDKSIIVKNWREIKERTDDNNFGRIVLLKILSQSEGGRKILDTEMSTLFEGNFEYYYFIKGIQNNDIYSNEQIVELLLREPTKMLENNLNRCDSSLYTYDFIYLLDKIDEILSTTPDLEIPKVEQIREAIEELLVKNFDKILEATKIMIDNYSGELYSTSMLKSIKKWDGKSRKISEMLEQNYEEISNNILDSEFLELLHIYSDIGDYSKKIDATTIINRLFSSDIGDEYILKAITEIAKELIEDQQIEPNMMEVYGSGYYSKALRIGEYIFKVGERRSTPDIPYDERIIQPLIRQEIMGENNQRVYLEVQNLVEKDWYSGLQENEIEEELYKIYAEMRDRGHRWTDIRKENVGRLKKPNVAHYKINGDEIRPFNSARGINAEENVEHKVLDAGELVIIDTDFIYEQDDKRRRINFSTGITFEKRYQDERGIEENKQDTRKDNDGR